MSGSLSRLLIDHKDEKESGVYGGLIKTGWLVVTLQSAIVLLIGFALAPVLSKILAIQADLEGDFVGLMRWQCITLALSMLVRIFTYMLWAHQRFDVINASQTITLAANFVFLWYFFHAGEGVFSLAWSGLLASFVGTGIAVAAALKLRLLPPK